MRPTRSQRTRLGPTRRPARRGLGAAYALLVMALDSQARPDVLPPCAGGGAGRRYGAAGSPMGEERRRMSEVYSSGSWKVKDGEDEAFVAAWKDFAGWLKEMPGSGTARLT